MAANPHLDCEGVSRRLARSEEPHDPDRAAASRAARFFSFAATQEVKDVQIAILNRDTGTNSRDLIAMFSGSPNFSAIDFLDDESQIAPAIDSRQAIFVLYIQSDFSRELNGGRPATVQLMLDGRRSNAAQIVEGYANAIVARYNEELLSASRASPPSTVFVGRLWFNPNQTVTWNTVPSLVAILTTLMGLLVTALSVARERELGTFEQLLVSPLGPLEIIIGKAVPALILGIVQASGMIAVGVALFRVPFEGSIVLLYGSMIVYLFAVIGVGLFVSSLAKTQQQAILGALCVHGSRHVPFGFCQPDREHARLAAIRDAGESDPLLHRDRERDLSEKCAGLGDPRQFVAHGRDCRDHAFERCVAFSASNGMI